MFERPSLSSCPPETSQIVLFQISIGAGGVLLNRRQIIFDSLIKSSSKTLPAARLENAAQCPDQAAVLSENMQVTGFIISKSNSAEFGDRVCLGSLVNIYKEYLNITLPQQYVMSAIKSI